MSWLIFELVRFPFPFTDHQTNKKRPVIVWSTSGFRNDSQHR